MKSFSNIAEYLTGALFNVVFIIIAIAAVTLVSTRAYAYGMNLFTKDTSVPLEEYTVVIPQGETENRADPMEAGKILEEAGLTNNAFIFFIQSKLNGLDNEFRPGTYVFNTHMADNMIMEKMSEAQFAAADDASITIPEGLNIRQIGMLCEGLGFFSEAEFVQACEDYEKTFYFLDQAPEKPSRLEGYLFPDTYRLPQDPTPQDLIDRMLVRFQEMFGFEMEERAAELGLTIDEVVTIASIIEKEVRQADERGKCSSIIYNRLNQNMPLEMCSTVLYVLDKPKVRLLYSDLEVESPYNTYKYAGLPVGPISSPGIRALEAALYPEDTNYLYMVVSNEDEGTHVFTNDYGEFLNAKELYNQQF